MVKMSLIILEIQQYLKFAGTVMVLNWLHVVQIIRCPSLMSVKFYKARIVERGQDWIIRCLGKDMRFAISV
eukprot:m.14904 g.14904  ORF g.14904 m.14904 type:complete len:71 (+) comp26037_c0_seq2:1834-2046(+)